MNIDIHNVDLHPISKGRKFKELSCSERATIVLGITAIVLFITSVVVSVIACISSIVYKIQNPGVNYIGIILRSLDRYYIYWIFGIASIITLLIIKKKL